MEVWKGSTVSTAQEEDVKVLREEERKDVSIVAKGLPLCGQSLLFSY